MGSPSPTWMLRVPPPGSAFREGPGSQLLARGQLMDFQAVGTGPGKGSGGDGVALGGGAGGRAGGVGAGVPEGAGSVAEAGELLRQVGVGGDQDLEVLFLRFQPFDGSLFHFGNLLDDAVEIDPRNDAAYRHSHDPAPLASAVGRPDAFVNVFSVNTVPAEGVGESPRAIGIAQGLF